MSGHRAIGHKPSAASHRRRLAERSRPGHQAPYTGSSGKRGLGTDRQRRHGSSSTSRGQTPDGSNLQPNRPATLQQGVQFTDQMVRLVVGRIAATPSGPIKRLIGTVDVAGRGTLHPLHDVDPVVLFDAAKIPEAGLPAFGRHPHYGVIACTVVLEGSVGDSDNLGGSGSTGAGGVYACSSGRGCCHEEASLEKAALLQIVFRIPQAKLDLPPSVLRVEDPPEVDNVKVLFGTYAGVRSPATPDAFPDAIVLRIAGTTTLDLPETYPHAACVVFGGTGTIAGQPVDAAAEEILLVGKGTTLSIVGDDLDVVLVAGAPMLDEPWVKKLGNNGFGVFEDRATADNIMATMVARGTDFTYRDLDAIKT